RRHTRFKCDWSSDVCSSDLPWNNPGRPPSPWTGWPREPDRARIEVMAVVVAPDFGAEVGLVFPDLYSGQRIYTADEAPETPVDRSEERRVGNEWRLWRVRAQ